MANKSTKRDITILNPMFPIPDGTDEFEYDEDAEIIVALDEQTLEEGYDSILLDDPDAFSEPGVDDDIDYSDILEAPEIYGVIEQIVRIGPDGSQRIDVVLDVQDITGAVNYEKRVAKLS